MDTTKTHDDESSIDNNDNDKDIAYLINLIQKSDIKEFLLFFEDAKIKSLDNYHDMCVIVLKFICEMRTIDDIFAVLEYIKANDPKKDAEWANCALYFACNGEGDSKFPINHENVIRLLECPDVGPNKNISNTDNQIFGVLNIFPTICKSGNETLVKIFLDSGKVDPTIVDKKGDTTLHTVCLDHKLKHILKILLDDGKFDPNKKNIEGNTPLHHVCSEISYPISHADSDMLKMMLDDVRIDPTICNNQGDNALHILCTGMTLPAFGNGRGYSKVTRSDEQTIEMITVLIEDGRIDPNKFNNVGLTPFGCACKNNNLKYIKYLSTCQSVDTKKCEKNGKSAVELICGDRYKTVEFILENCQ